MLVQQAWAAFAAGIFSASTMAATFVYVSNAEDGDIGMYTLQRDGSLKPGERFKAEKPGMSMTVSADKRFLVARVRSESFSAYTFTIGLGTRAIKLVCTGPLAARLTLLLLDHSS